MSTHATSLSGRGRTARQHGFTLLELLVLAAMLAIVASLMIPSLGRARGAARVTGCRSNLQRIGLALGQYLGDSSGALPQGAPEELGATAGIVFGGKAGSLSALGVDRWTWEKRPLNAYVPGGSEDPVAAAEIFHSPADKGGNLPGIGATRSIFELLGTSYVLNDHTPLDERSATLIPRGGGPMPPIDDPARTWVCASHPVYNFQGGGDRAQHWYSKVRIQTMLLFADMHSDGPMVVAPPGALGNERYTCLPSTTPR